MYNTSTDYRVLVLVMYSQINHTKSLWPFVAGYGYKWIFKAHFVKPLCGLDKKKELRPADAVY